MALCERCGEEITVANDLDLADDVDRRGHLVMVAGSPPLADRNPLADIHAALPDRGDVVYNDSIYAELSEGRDRPSAALIREHMR